MTPDQALVLLERCLLVAFPYTDPKDDPDPKRGREQVEARAALALLAGPTPGTPDQPYTMGEIVAFEAGYAQGHIDGVSREQGLRTTGTKVQRRDEWIEARRTYLVSSPSKTG